MENKKTVWVLTEEINAYDQYGRYFIAVWFKKPTAESIAKVIGRPANCDLVDHILAGGGRRGVEDDWYNLDEEDAQDD